MKYLYDILNIINEPAAFIDTHYRYLFVNKAFGKIHGCLPEAMIGKPLSEYIDIAQYKRRIKPALDKAFRGAGIHIEIVQPVMDTVEERFIQLNFHAHYSEKGDVDGVIITALDKSEEVTLSENWLNAMDAVEDIVCLIDKDYTILDINRHGAETLGKKKEEILGKKCHDILHNNKDPKSFCPLPLCQYTGRTEKAEIYKAENNRYYSIKTSPIFSREGKLLRFIDIMRDITPIKLKERELNTINSELSDKNEEYQFINERLNKLNEYYTLINQYSSDVIAMYDDQLNTVYISPSARNYIGYNEKELSNINIFDIVHPEDKTRLLNEIAEHKRNGEKNYTTTYRVRHKEGYYFWNESVSHIVTEKDRVFIIVNSRNIDKRKKAESAQAGSESKFKAFIENANDIIYQVSTDGIFTYASPNWTDLLGYKTEEVIGERVDKFVHPEDVQLCLDFLTKVISTGKKQSGVEYRVKHKNGSWRWHNSNGAPLMDASGNTISYIGIARDITEQIRYNQKILEQSREYKQLYRKLKTTNKQLVIAKEKSEENERRLKTLLGNLQGVAYQCMYDENWTMFFISQGIKALTGFEMSDIKNNHRKSWNEIIHKDFREYVRRVVETAIDNSKSFTLEYKICCKNGDEKWVWEKGAAIYKDEKISHIEGFITDITSLKNFEHELMIAKEKAEQANRLKTEFLQNMSHEVRTPMNGIIGFSQLLDEQDMNKEKQKYYTRIIQKSSQQLMQVIDDILEISTLETKQERIYESDFCINDLLMELFSIYTLKTSERKIPIYLNNALPDSECIIRSDRSKIHKILTNLLDNALKFTKTGFIEMGYFVKDSYLTLYVKDTGIGISSENHEVIFERFSQENKDISQKIGGLGLGLAISKENAKLLGGDITLESAKGKGSTFFLSIPVKFGNQISMKPTLEALSPNSSKDFTLLIAEDEEINSIYIETLITNALKDKIRIIHARNGQEAVDQCLNQKVDLVLMDIKMPVMSGNEATRIIRSRYPYLPIIAQTAYASTHDKESAQEKGYNHYLTKPIEKEKLFSILNQYLNQD